MPYMDETTRWLHIDDTHLFMKRWHPGDTEMMLPEWHVEGFVVLRQVYHKIQAKWYAWEVHLGKEKLIDSFESLGDAKDAIEGAFLNRPD